MEKRYYNAESLDRAIREFEREYGMTTAAFYESYSAGNVLDIPCFAQHVWASFYEDVLRMSKDRPIESRPVLARVNQTYACT